MPKGPQGIVDAIITWSGGKHDWCLLSRCIWEQLCLDSWKITLSEHVPTFQGKHRVSTVLTMKAMLLEGKCVNCKIEAQNHVFSVELGKLGANPPPSF